MSIKEAVYYAGLMVGLIIGTFAMRALGANGILQILGALVVGVGLGFVAQKLYESGKQGPPR
jgi:positive regulator of sigma E activity